MCEGGERERERGREREREGEGVSNKEVFVRQRKTVYVEFLFMLVLSKPVDLEALYYGP